MKTKIQNSVRDMRIKEKFFMDDFYLDKYASLCGPFATLVYLCLCRHADAQQASFPSGDMMAKKLKISRSSVTRGIKALVDWNIIAVERTRKSDKTWLNNTYILLDKSNWSVKEPSVPLTHGGGGEEKGDFGPTDSTHASVGHLTHASVARTKDTHDSKDTHDLIKDMSTYPAVRVLQTRPAGDEDTSGEALVETAKSAEDLAEDAEAKKRAMEVNLVIDAFKPVNPAYARLFAQKPQRAAVSRLIDIHGLEQVQRCVAILPQTNAVQFFPIITTPYELEKKWAALESAVQRHRAGLLVTKKPIADFSK